MRISRDKGMKKLGLCSYTTGSRQLFSQAQSADLRATRNSGNESKIKVILTDRTRVLVQEIRVWCVVTVDHSNKVRPRHSISRRPL